MCARRLQQQRHFVAEGCKVVFQLHGLVGDILNVERRVGLANAQRGVVEQRHEAVAKRKVARGEFRRNGREVIVHMLLSRFAEAHQPVVDLAQRVMHEVERGAEPYGLCRIGAAQPYGFAAAQAFEQHLFRFEVALCLLEHPAAFLKQPVGGDSEDVGIFCRLLCHAHREVAQQHAADGLRVAAAAHLVKEHVVLFFFFGLLFGKAALAVNEGVDACADDDDYCRHAAEAHGQGHEEASREGHAGGDEPAADHRKHARYAEHRALAAPSAVGERGTHGYHKGYVSSGEGQFQGGAKGDEQGGYDEVHRSAHEVVCRAVGQGHVGRREAAFHEVRHGTRRDALHECAYIGSHAHQAAGYARRAEHLVALIAARQPHLGLHHIVRLLRPRQREHHNQAGGEEEHGLGVRRSVERVHAETPRIGAARGGKVAERRQACEGHADKVHEVVAGKGRGEGEGAREHHDAEHVYFQRVQQLHEQREHHEARAEYNKYMFI